MGYIYNNYDTGITIFKDKDDKWNAYSMYHLERSWKKGDRLHDVILALKHFLYEEQKLSAFAKHPANGLNNI